MAERVNLIDGPDEGRPALEPTPQEQLRRGLLQWARMWDHFGISVIRRDHAPASVRGEPHPAAACPTESVVTAPAVGRTVHEQDLDLLRSEIAECTRCSELAATRTQTVPGVGNPQARVCFLGEAPGADEDKQGEPFVGRAGQLLNRIIEACGMRREEVYILNVLKCRPPGNRNPSFEEAEACRPFFERQLQIIHPEYIVCLGRVAATTLLESSLSMNDLRGKFHRWRDIKVLATYHPAYLLRKPEAKRLVWDDMKILLADMGLPVPSGGGNRDQDKTADPRDSG